MDEAVANNAVLGGQLYQDGLEDDTPEGEALRRETGDRILASKAREFHTLGTVLGLGYEDSPIVLPDGAPPALRDGKIYTPSARPGSLAPHAWLPDGRALYDLFGPGLTLVAAQDADDRDIAQAQADARAARAPLAVVRPEGVAVRALYGAALTLVRPDQYVAWRGPHWFPDALRHSLGLTTVAEPA